MKRAAVVLCLIISFTSTIVSGWAGSDDHEQTLQSLLADAQSAQARGDFRVAAESYRKVTELAPSIPEVWANLGLMYHESGKYSAAMESFTKAARLSPSLFVPQLFLGIEYLAARNPEAAIPHLEEAARLNPQDVQAFRSLGKAYSLQGQSDRAADAYWKTTELAPNDGSSWFDLGTAYLQQVENDARVMNSRYGDSAYAKLRAAEALAEEGKMIPSQEAYKTALALQSSIPCGFAEFGIALLRTREIAKAREEFEQEIRAGSGCGLAALGLAVADLASGDPGGALTRLTPIAKADPGFLRASLPLFRGAASADQVTALLGLAQSQPSAPSSFDIGSCIQETLLSEEAAPPPADLDRGQPPEVETFMSADAKQFYEAGQFTDCSQSLKPSLQTTQRSQLPLLAACSFYAGDYRIASRAAQRLRRSPETRAQGLYWESKADEYLAVRALTRAGEIDADSPRMHLLLGDVFREKQRWGEAEAEYRKTVALDPSSRSARLSLAITLFSELKTDEALSLDRAILAEAPDDPEMNLLAGELLIEQNHFSESEPYLLKCTGLKPELAPRSHVLLGRVYGETSRVPAAIAEYKLALGTDEDGSIHYQLGRLYQKSGDKAAALVAFKEAKILADRKHDRERVAFGQSPPDASRQ